MFFKLYRILFSSGGSHPAFSIDWTYVVCWWWWVFVQLQLFLVVCRWLVVCQSLSPQHATPCIIGLAEFWNVSGNFHVSYSKSSARFSFRRWRAVHDYMQVHLLALANICSSFALASRILSHMASFTAHIRRCRLLRMRGPLTDIRFGQVILEVRDDWWVFHRWRRFEATWSDPGHSLLLWGCQPVRTASMSTTLYLQKKDEQTDECLQLQNATYCNRFRTKITENCKRQVSVHLN